MNIRQQYLLILCLSLIAIKSSAQATSAAKTAFEEFYYLDSGLLISQHHIRVEHPAEVSRTIPDLNLKDAYILEDSGTNIIQFNPVQCYLDPFSPEPDSRKAREMLSHCLQVRVWENEQIPYWMKTMGAAVILGAATGSGAIDEELSFSLNFDEMDAILRRWLSDSGN